MTLDKIALSEMIKNVAASPRRRPGASSDYSLVRQHFDLIAAARAAGLPWRMIKEAAEFEGLAARNQEKILSLYFHTIQRNRVKAALKAKAAAVSVPAPAPAMPAPAMQAFNRQLPPPPGSAPAASPGDVFDSLPSLSAARKAF